MKVAELMSVLSELSPDDLVVIGITNLGHTTYVAADESVYSAIVEIDGAENAVVIDCTIN